MGLLLPQASAMGGLPFGCGSISTLATDGVAGEQRAEA